MSNVDARRQQARQVFDAYFEACPSRRLLERISDKWVVLVLTALGEGPMRYTELATKIAGVSQKMLTQTLRALERDGLVERRVTPSVPVRVDYELTHLGRSLSERISLLKQWAEANMEAIDAARVRYDAIQ